MTSVLVTGCAGFIGSRLARECLDQGDVVRGVDVLTDYYDVGQKRDNLTDLLGHPAFEFVPADLADGCDALLDGIDVVYHQAGQPGVRSSWHHDFDDHVRCNITATQRLLEAATTHRLRRLVFASSSSVYGNAATFPIDEVARTLPHSPYGVSKLAAENLCALYAANFGLSVVVLRYFTVYGPHQRPDMAIYRMFEAALNGEEFPLFGDGRHVRDFTFVVDVVRANLNAAESDVPAGFTANIAGGSQCSMAELIDMIEGITGRRIHLDRQGNQRGDVARTDASTVRAREQLGWRPTVDLHTGLSLQHDWHKQRRRPTGARPS